MHMIWLIIIWASEVWVYTQCSIFVNFVWIWHLCLKKPFLRYYSFEITQTLPSVSLLPLSIKYIIKLCDPFSYPFCSSMCDQFYLNLHPASHIVTSKICTNDIQHVHREGSERDWFLILIMPSASEFASLIPNLLHLGIVLDDDGIFEKGSGTGICSITIQSIFGVSSGAARIDADVKLSVVATQSSWQMYAIDIAVNKKQNMNAYVNVLLVIF